ncbi:hypothetical protein [Thermovibrio sp.]
MTLIEFDLTVITVCFVLITVFLLTLLVVLYRLLKKLEESVDTVNSQLKPAVYEVRSTVKNLTESFQRVNSLLSFAKRFKRSKED